MLAFTPSSGICVMHTLQSSEHDAISWSLNGDQSRSSTADLCTDTRGTSLSLHGWSWRNTANTPPPPAFHRRPKYLAFALIKFESHPVAVSFVLVKHCSGFAGCANTLRNLD